MDDFLDFPIYFSRNPYFPSPEIRFLMAVGFLPSLRLLLYVCS